MKKDKKLLVLDVLVIGILWLSLAPMAKGLVFTYSDNVINLTVSGPDLAKPGTNETFTVSGKFAVVANDFVYIVLWLNTSSQPFKVILEEYALPPRTYNATDTFSKTYQVLIPNDAINNRCIYANVTTSIRHFSFDISLVQNPTYTELQSQVTALQSQLSSLQAQNDDLQSQVNGLQADKSQLRSQVDSLNSDVTNLNSQISSLQSQLNDIRAQDTNATNLSLFAMAVAAVFVVTTIFFALRKPKVKTI